VNGISFSQPSHSYHSSSENHCFFLNCHAGVAAQTRVIGVRPVLESNVNIFIGQMGSILSNTPENISKFRLDEFTVTVEISAKGEISILGTGAGVEAKGGVEFKFKRT